MYIDQLPKVKAWAAGEDTNTIITAASFKKAERALLGKGKRKVKSLSDAEKRAFEEQVGNQFKAKPPPVGVPVGFRQR